MKFTEIYSRAIRYWPEEIFIGDGLAKGESGYSFPTLTNAWNDAEDALDENDQWLSLTTWCMFQAFHSASKQHLKKGVEILKPKEVTLSEIESRISEQLKSEGWEILASQYEDDRSYN